MTVEEGRQITKQTLLALPFLFFVFFFFNLKKLKSKVLNMIIWAKEEVSSPILCTLQTWAHFHPRRDHSDPQHPTTSRINFAIPQGSERLLMLEIIQIVLVVRVSMMPPNYRFSRNHIDNNVS